MFLGYVVFTELLLFLHILSPIGPDNHFPELCTLPFMRKHSFMILSLAKIPHRPF